MALALYISRDFLRISFCLLHKGKYLYSILRFPSTSQSISLCCSNMVGGYKSCRNVLKMYKEFYPSKWANWKLNQEVELFEPNLAQCSFSGVSPLSNAKLIPIHLFYHSNEFQMELKYILDLAGLVLVVVPSEETCLFTGLFIELREQSFSFQKNFFLLWKCNNNGVTRECLWTQCYKVDQTKHTLFLLTKMHCLF